jgi:hypothetical protein
MGSENNEMLDAAQDQADELATTRDIGRSYRSFDAWLDALDELALGKYGLSSGDLPADKFEAAYRSGISPIAYLTGAIQRFLGEMRHELEVEELFRESQQSGRNLHAPHVLDEAGLDCIAEAPEGDADPMDGVSELVPEDRW